MRSPQWHSLGSPPPPPRPPPPHLRVAGRHYQVVVASRIVRVSPPPPRRRHRARSCRSPAASLLPTPAAPAPASPRRTPARGTKPLPAPGAAREYSAGTLAPTDRCEREVDPCPSIGPPWSGASHPPAVAPATPDRRASHPRCAPA